MNLKTTTLRQLIKEDLDLAFRLKLCYFHDSNIVRFITTTDKSKDFNTQGLYGPYDCGGVYGGMYQDLLDVPLYLGD